jgi:hypothetical protein
VSDLGDRRLGAWNHPGGFDVIASMLGGNSNAL